MQKILTTSGPNLEAAQSVLKIFKKASERTNRKEPEFTKACFDTLILNIVVNQKYEHESSEKQAIASRAMHGSGTGTQAEIKFLKVEIPYDWVVSALKTVLSVGSKA